MMYALFYRIFERKLIAFDKWRRFRTEKYFRSGVQHPVIEKIK